MRSIEQIVREEGMHTLRQVLVKLQTNSLRHAVATHDIQKKYNQVGGFSSPLGMPIDASLASRQIPLVIPQGNGQFSANFRGGTIKSQDTSTVPEAVVETEVEIRMVALECQIRQESEDEIFGSVGVIKASSHVADTHHFPDTDVLKFGPDGERIALLELILYHDAPADVLLACELVEHDSGNIDEYKKQVADLVSKAAQAGGAALGIPSEAVASSGGFINELATGLTNVVFDVLGADDDPYNPQTLRISALDMQNHSFSKQPLHRSDDPRTAEFTHSIVLSGEDQGGSLGKYGFYFIVDVTKVSRILQ